VSATGNLQPTNEVDVGSEVSGLVETVLVDDNDRVKNGQVLARLDVSKLQDQVVNARAALASADARVLQAAARQTAVNTRHLFVPGLITRPPSTRTGSTPMGQGPKVSRS